jgi:hypothetical protein
MGSRQREVCRMSVGSEALVLEGNDRLDRTYRVPGADDTQPGVKVK